MQNKHLYLELLFFLCSINEGLIVIANVEKDKDFTSAESFFVANWVTSCSNLKFFASLLVL